MKRNFKLLCVITAALAMLCLMFVMNVSAAKPEVSIAYKNVAYTEAPQLVLYVDSQNLGAGQSVKVMFYDEEPKAVVYDAAAAKDPVSKIEYSGKEYDAFYSEPCAPARIRVDIYAVALVVDSDGNIVTKSDVLKYNVFEYAMDRFSMSPTADQTALYTALLDFAASVQDVFYTENNIDTVGGWADAYYGIKLQHVVEGKVTDSTAYYSRKVGNVSAVAPVSSGEYAFSGFEYLDGTPVTDGYMTPQGDTPDVSDKEISGSWRYRNLEAKKLGYTTYNMIYTKDAKTYTFEKGTEIKSLRSISFGSDFFYDVQYPETDSAGQPSDPAQKGIYIYSDESDGSMVIKSTAGKNAHTDKGGGYQNWGCLAFPAYKCDDNFGTVGTKYILEFDFMYAAAPTYHRYSRFGMQVAEKPANSSSLKNFAALDIQPSQDSAAFSTVQALNSTALDIGEWYNIRFEYEVTGANQYAEENYKGYSGKISYYVNGIKVGESTTSPSANANDAFGSIYLEFAGENFEYRFDNIYTSTVPFDDELGGGDEYPTLYDKYSAGLLDGYTTVVHNMNDSADASDFVSIDFTSCDGYTDSYARAEAGALALGAFGLETKVQISADVDGIKKGSTVIVEFDYKLVGHGEYTNPAVANHQLFTLSLLSSGAEQPFEKCYFYKSNDGSYASLNPANAGFNTKALLAEQWYNIRIEMKVLESSMYVNYYIDGNLLDTFVKTDLPTDLDKISLTMLSNVASQEHVLDDIIVIADIPKEDSGDDNTGGDNTGGDNTGGDNTGTVDPEAPVSNPYENRFDFEDVVDVNTIPHIPSWYLGGTRNFEYKEGETDTSKLTAMSGLNTTKTYAYMSVVSAEQKDGTVGDVLLTGTQGAIGVCAGGWKINATPKVMKSKVGAVYTVEMDFKYEYDSVLMKNDGKYPITYFGMNGNGTTANSNSADDFAALNLWIPEGLESYDGKVVMGMNNASQAVLEEGQWYTVRVEYTVYTTDDTSTGTKEGSGQIKIYIGGELKETYIQNGAYNSAFEGLYLEMRGASNVQGQRFWIDNLTMTATAPATEGGESFNDGRGSGVYYNKYASEEITDAKFYGFNFDGDMSWMSSKKWNAAGVVTSGGKVSVKTDAYSYYTVVSDVDTAAGETWVCEFDYMYSAYDAQKAGTVGYLKIYDGTAYAGTDYIANIYITQDANGIKLGTASKNKVLEMGYWYNIRIEITDKTAKVYVDDIEVAVGIGVTGNATDTGYDGLNLWFEQGNNSISGYDYCIDNLIYYSVPKS